MWDPKNLRSHMAKAGHSPASLLRKVVMRGWRTLGAVLGSCFTAAPTRAVFRAKVPKVALPLLCLQCTLASLGPRRVSFPPRGRASAGAQSLTKGRRVPAGWLPCTQAAVQCFQAPRAHYHPCSPLHLRPAAAAQAAGCVSHYRQTLQELTPLLTRLWLGSHALRRLSWRPRSVGAMVCTSHAAVAGSHTSVRACSRIDHALNPCPTLSAAAL